MAQKIIKIGSSYGVTLRSDVLDALGLRQGDKVSVRSNSKSGTIEIRSARAEEDQQKLVEAQRLVEKHKEQLSKLSAE